MYELPNVKLLLKTELDALRTQMTRQTEAPPENVAAIDVFDGAQTVEQQEFVALSTSRLARRAGEVRNALERLREGNYGLCEDCGSPISAPRLVAAPTATTCVPCQFELEQRPRKYAHRPSTPARHRSSPARAGIEDGIANRPSKVRDPL